MVRNVEHAPITQSLQGDQKIIPGVDPKTHNFLSDAEKLNLLNSLDPLTRTLIEHYFLQDVSSQDLARENNISKPTVIARIRKGLEIIWAKAPREIQDGNLKAEVIKMKDPFAFSPATREKKSRVATYLWKNKEYRAKTVKALKRRRWDPRFIEKMRKIRKGRPPERHSNAETSRRISEGVKKSWKFRANGISKDDIDTWDYACSHDLLPKMQRMGFLADGDIQILRDVFENRIIGKSAQATLNRFSIVLTKTME